MGPCAELYGTGTKRVLLEGLLFQEVQTCTPQAERRLMVKNLDLTSRGLTLDPGRPP